MSLFAQSELESIKNDARSSEGKSPEERMAMFSDLLKTLDVAWQGLTPEERDRRLQIHRELNRLPEPLWKNVRPEAIRDDAATDQTR